MFVLHFFPLEFHVHNKIYKSYILSWSLHKILYNQSRSTCKKGKSTKIFSVSTQFNELDNSLRFYCPRGSGAVRSSRNSDVRGRSRREHFRLSAIQHGLDRKMSGQTKRALVNYFYIHIYSVFKRDLSVNRKKILGLRVVALKLRPQNLCSSNFE